MPDETPLPKKVKDVQTVSSAYVAFPPLNRAHIDKFKKLLKNYKKSYVIFIICPHNKNFILVIVRESNLFCFYFLGSMIWMAMMSISIFSRSCLHPKNGYTKR